MAAEVVVEDVIADLKRVQDFDPKTLVQQARLGDAGAFEGAVKPATRLIDLFMKLPTEAVREFPVVQKQNIQSWSKSAYALFDEILQFSLDEGSVEQRKQALITKLRNEYQTYFNHLFPLISYAVARTVDFNRLSEEGRAAVQSIRDETAKLTTEIHGTSENAKLVLDEVREAAAEHGVTQEAKYFSDEASAHQVAATKWLWASSIAGAVVVAYAVATLFFPQIDWFRASTTAEAIQLTASKILIFLVLSYLLFQCVRNYSAHQHNAVANKHRQNALMTYRTLAEAGGSPEARDTVLQHAAAAIYAPNDSGYLKTEERGYGGNPIVGFSPKSAIDIASTGGGHS